ASAIGVSPGAEAGSIHLRRGDDFVFIAQQGFSDDLLGLVTPAAAAEIWHGDRDAWRRGEPRIARAAELAEHASRQSSLGFDTAADLERAGRTREILANLCLPIVLGGQVAAHLNLDAFSSPDAFTATSVAEARQYALQATALLAASRERAELLARSREFEVLEAIAHALRTADSTAVIAARLADEAVRLVSCPHAALLLRGPGANLRVTTGRGLFSRWLGLDVPPGTGLSWGALNARQVLRSDDVNEDPRAYRPFATGPGGHSQLTAPLFTAAGEPLGVLIAARDRREAFSELDARLIGLMADVGATAIERLQTADRLEQQARESTALLELSRILETEDTPAAGLEHLRRLANADVAVYATLRGGAFTPTAQAGTPNPALAGLVSAGLRFEGHPAERPVWRDRRGGHQVTALDDHPLANLLADAGVECAYFTLLQTEGLPGGLALFRAQRHAPPVRWAGDVNATLDLPPSEQPRAFGWTDAEVRLLEAAARTLGAVAARSERVNNLEAAHEGALRAIGLALEARDHETGGHTDRVATLADRLGEKLGLDAEQRKALRWGAYLHDVGKLGIPDAILLKPGALSNPERAIMRTHPSQGFELTLNLPFLPETARAVVLHHHERWDGQGYPAGLSGRHTPLAARIFAVCDVFDALISVRPYKPAMPEPEAREEIRRAVQQGQFDPEVVAAFEALFDDAPGRAATDLYSTATA
ncbi:MAG TPA: HD domain-containing phosphohydrolase, partial [Deinococcales bacterium]|nr:HD domain-containing phosphohydrolase [Deinococcales bacterium]